MRPVPADTAAQMSAQAERVRRLRLRGASGSRIHWSGATLSASWSGQLLYSLAYGRVYLGGEVSQVGLSSTIATLPADVRPATDRPLWFASGSGLAVVVVASSGAVTALSYPGPLRPLGAAYVL